MASQLQHNQDIVEVDDVVIEDEKRYVDSKDNDTNGGVGDDNDSSIGECEWVEWKASSSNSNVLGEELVSVMPVPLNLNEVMEVEEDSDASESSSTQAQENGAFGSSSEELPMALPLHLKDHQNNYDQRCDERRKIHERAESFWHHYDECVILCLGAQLGILLRRLSNFATSNLNLVFNEDSALAPDLPVNCLALFILGLICSGKDALDVVSYDVINRDERHEIALQIFERRIRASISLVLFPAKREEADALVRYTNYNNNYDNDEESGDINDDKTLANTGERTQQCRRRRKVNKRQQGQSSLEHDEVINNRLYDQNMTQLQQLQWETEQTALTIADGWDVGTTPEAMKVDLMLGLRVGFCGALSTLSSWNEDMVNLLRNGHIGHALVGYLLGVFLPILSYRIGQHAALGIFLHRAREKIRFDEQRTGGYGLRIHRSEEDAELSPSKRRSLQERVTERDYPSVRAAATALFTLLLVAQVTAIFVFPSRSQQQFAISLLFSPLGVLARRQLLFLNHRHTPKSLWRYLCGHCFPACFIDDHIEEPETKDDDVRFANKHFASVFPVGTFLCNVLGCLLSGSIGSLLAGNPGPEESVFLESIILGFAGSLSTLAFLVEVLKSIDPLVSNYGGTTYCLSTLFWGLIVGLISSL